MENKIFFPLLKKVGRTFYLTIRLLPRPLQEPVALAYLLARASDTIADEGNFSPEERTVFLHFLKKGELPVQEWRERLTGTTHMMLLSALPELIASLENPMRDSAEAHAIRSVWNTILEGQLFDVALHCTLFTKEELERYLYLVGGCVGEFWTRLGVSHFKNFSKEPLEQMMTWGVAYGNGLQLLNILRDLVADRAKQKFYFHPSKRSELINQVSAYLQEGRLYVRALQDRRLRYASALPLLLAEETLKLVIKSPDRLPMKVSRWKVYFALLKAATF